MRFALANCAPAARSAQMRPRREREARPLDTSPWRHAAAAAAAASQRAQSKQAKANRKLQMEARPVSPARLSAPSAARN